MINSHMKRHILKICSCLLVLTLPLCACSFSKDTDIHSSKNATNDENTITESEEDAFYAVNFNKTLDNYEPKKKSYNFYFTYKLVHPWWDAVAMGIEDAVADYENRGIYITYEYLAPASVSADDQVNRIKSAADGNYDLIGVDVADVSVLTPVINALIDDGKKVMTFSSSDADESAGCKRIAYVGNTHNYEDGVDLTNALCKKLGYKGKVAILIGDENVPCHEDRAKGARDVIAQYDEMEIVAEAYDHDSIDNAYDITKDFLAKYDDLAGIICCNMSNPVGAARAVIEENRTDIVIVGMDHDKESLEYLRDGYIYCLGVQDCYSIGYDTIQVAIKISDGHLPGNLYSEKTEEKTTLIYKDSAQELLFILYGEAG